MLNMHRNFIMKPNPYISNEDAERAFTTFLVSQAAGIFATISLSMSLFKIMPKISLNSAYKKFTVVEFVVAFGLMGYYGYDLLRMRKMIPDEEFEARLSSNQPAARKINPQ